MLEWSLGSIERVDCVEVGSTADSVAVSRDENIRVFSYSPGIGALVPLKFHVP